MKQRKQLQKLELYLRLLPLSWFSGVTIKKPQILFYSFLQRVARNRIQIIRGSLSYLGPLTDHEKNVLRH